MKEGIKFTFLLENVLCHFIYLLKNSVIYVEIQISNESKSHRITRENYDFFISASN